MNVGDLVRTFGWTPVRKNRYWCDFGASTLESDVMGHVR